MDTESMFALMEGWTRNESPPLTVWSHPRHGRHADGLFRMHDEQGFSLADSLVECARRGLTPCIGQFRADALAAGWSREKADEVVRNASIDAEAAKL